MIKTKRLKVGSQRYKIEEDFNGLIKQGCLGLTKQNESLILYASEFPKDVVADTLIHETLHAIVHNYMYDIDGAVEEEFVTQLAHGIVQVMRDNPKFIDEVRSLL